LLLNNIINNNNNKHGRLQHMVDMDHSGSNDSHVVRGVYGLIISPRKAFSTAIMIVSVPDVGCWCAVEIIMIFFMCIDQRMRRRLNDRTEN
jgi:hypothetical protein